MQITSRELLQSVDVRKKEPKGPFKPNSKQTDWVEKMAVFPFVFRLPHMRWPIIPLGILFFCLGFTSSFLLWTEYDTTWGGALLGWWFLFFATSLGVFILTGTILSALFWVYEKMMYTSKIYYFTHGTATELQLALSAGLSIIPAYFFLYQDGLNGTYTFYLFRTLGSLCFLFAVGAVVKVVVRHTVVRLTKSSMWTVMATALERERVIRKLSKPFHPASPLRPLRNLAASKEPSVQDLVRSWKHVRKEEPFGLGYAPSSIRSKKLLKVTEDMLKHQARNIVANITKSEIQERTFDREDLKNTVKEDSYEIAEKFFFPGDQVSIGIRDVVELLRDHYDSRVALKDSLNDRHDISKNLSLSIRLMYYLLMCLALIAIVYEISLSALLVPFSGLILGYSFVFGRTMQRILEAFVLTVVVRPYNVGDRVVLESFPDRMACIVSKINLLTTEAFSTDGQKWIIPNHRASEMIITQQQKSRNYAVTFTVNLPNHSFDRDVYQRFKDRLQHFFDNDTAPWNCNPANWSLMVTNLTDLNRVSLLVWVQLLGINWSSPKRYSIPKMNLYFAIQEICRTMGIEYDLPPQPISLEIPDGNGFPIVLRTLPKDSMMSMIGNDNVPEGLAKSGQSSKLASSLEFMDSSSSFGVESLQGTIRGGGSKKSNSRKKRTLLHSKKNSDSEEEDDDFSPSKPLLSHEVHHLSGDPTSVHDPLISRASVPVSTTDSNVEQGGTTRRRRRNKSSSTRVRIQQNRSRASEFSSGSSE